MPNGPTQAAQSSAINQFSWPSLQAYYQPSDDYANEVEMVENKHDAVLTFYRRRGSSRSQVKAITVPKALLAQLTAAKDSK